MSQMTVAEWFSDRPLIYPLYADQILRTSRLLGAETIEHLTEEPWDRDEDASFAALFGLGKYHKSLGSNIPASTLLNYIRRGRGYVISVGASTLGTALWKAATASIPNELSNNVSPCVPGFHVGMHDIVSADSEEVLCRASFSFSLWGWSIPPDLTKFQELYFQLDLVRKLEADLSDIWGPLQRRMYADC